MYTSHCTKAATLNVNLRHLSDPKRNLHNQQTLLSRQQVTQSSYTLTLSYTRLPMMFLELEECGILGGFLFFFAPTNLQLIKLHYAMLKWAAHEQTSNVWKFSVRQLTRANSSRGYDMNPSTHTGQWDALLLCSQACVSSLLGCEW